MKLHTPQYKSIKGLFDRNIIHRMAHITGWDRRQFMQDYSEWFKCQI